MNIKSKLSIIAISLLSLSLLSACNNTKIDKENSFVASVLEVQDNSILVETDDEEIGSDKAVISFEKGKEIKSYEVGDEVTIYYDGVIKETYPVQITALLITKIEKEVSEEPKKANTEDFINEFAYKTSEHLLSKGNNNYSPLSLYYALSFANSGANGETRNELNTLLGLPQNIIEEEIDKLQKELYKDEEDSKLWLANSLWVEEEINGEKVNLEEDFLETVKDRFNAELFSMNFGSSLTGKEMGKWIAKNTNGVLEPKLTTQKGQLAAIINTIYFKDKWISPFTEELTKQSKFTLANGETKMIDFMNQSTNSGFTKGEDYKKADLSFMGGGSMSFILPNENIDLNSLLKQDKLREIMQTETESKKVNWVMPKFTIDSEFKLIPTLKKLGAEKAFGDQADFSNMIKDIDIYIDDVLQGTHISVEEGGVEAAAYTAITFKTTSIDIEEPKEMILDRPFIYVISDENNNILFIGTYVE